MPHSDGETSSKRFRRTVNATERLRLACRHEFLSNAQFDALLERLLAPEQGRSRLAAGPAANQSRYGPLT
jgi:hypothetical protein